MDELPRPVGGEIGCIEDYHLDAKEYFEHLETTISNRLKGLKVVLDCANGVSSALAPQLFKDLVAEIISIYDQLDGVNINESWINSSRNVSARSCETGSSFRIRF